MEVVATKLCPSLEYLGMGRKGCFLSVATLQDRAPTLGMPGLGHVRDGLQALGG